MNNKTKNKKLKYFITVLLVFLIATVSTIAIYAGWRDDDSTIYLQYGGDPTYRADFHDMIRDTFNYDLNCVEANNNAVHAGTYYLGTKYTTDDTILGYIRYMAKKYDWSSDIFSGQEQQMGLWQYIKNKNGGVLNDMDINLVGESSTEGTKIYNNRRNLPVIIK